MDRSSGVLLHISSLPGGYGCGSFGEGAIRFIDKLAKCGFHYWQVLPFCVPDSYHSPYSSSSTFSGNPYFIDIDELLKDGFITSDEAAAEREKSPYSCEFDRLRIDRMNLLFRAAERAKADASVAEEILEFAGDNPHIDEFCLFMAKKASNRDLPWNEWTVDVYDDDIRFAWLFIEWEFHRQWKKIKEYANSRGIDVIGDIPFYVSLDSSDVWAHREQFLLDEDGKPSLVAGVPPDYFAKDGQLWGNPLYDWDFMKNDGYRFWRDRLSFMLEMFDGVRIDHFRGIESYYAIKGDAKTAKDGTWMRGPGMDFVRVIKETAGDKLIIAEDLGDITDEVRELLDDSGFPGMRVLQFGFLGDGDSLHKPHNYPENSIAYTGTHDNNTLLGYIWEMPPERRRELFDYCGCREEWRDACGDVIRTVMASRSRIVILPMQDILAYGSDTRMNKPGIAGDNWSFRISREQLDEIDTEKFKRYNQIFAR